MTRWRLVSASSDGRRSECSVGRLSYGFDNVEFSALAGPPLTTINQPRYEAGRAAVEILLKQANSPDTVPEHRVFEVQLIERKSCRKL